MIVEKRQPGDDRPEPLITEVPKYTTHLPNGGRVVTTYTLADDEFQSARSELTLADGSQPLPPVLAFSDRTARQNHDDLHDEGDALGA